MSNKRLQSALHKIAVQCCNKFETLTTREYKAEMKSVKKLLGNDLYLNVVFHQMDLCPILNKSNLS